MLDRRMVNPPRVRFGGVGVGGGLAAWSLMLIPDSFLLVIFLAFLGIGGVAATLRLLARVLDDPMLGPFDDAPTDSALRVRTERGTTGIGVSPSKPRMRAMKLSKACSQTRTK
jgi:acetyl esterase/lipase